LHLFIKNYHDVSLFVFQKSILIIEGGSGKQWKKKSSVLNPHPKQHCAEKGLCLHLHFGHKFYFLIDCPREKLINAMLLVDEES
jgi:hypothetical protein